MDYVVGVVFSGSKRQILLIRKERPSWQKGLLNCPGGKVNPHETVAEAMSREFFQETGMAIEPDEWTLALVINGYQAGQTGYAVGPYRLHYLTCTANVLLAKTKTDEEIVTWDLDDAMSMPFNLLPDLYWIIPLLVKDDLLHLPVHMSRK